MEFIINIRSLGCILWGPWIFNNIGSRCGTGKWKTIQFSYLDKELWTLSTFSPYECGQEKLEATSLTSISQHLPKTFHTLGASHCYIQMWHHLDLLISCASWLFQPNNTNTGRKLQSHNWSSAVGTTVTSPLLLPQDGRAHAPPQRLRFHQGRCRPPDTSPRAPVQRGNRDAKDHGKGGEGGAESSERLRSE